MHCEQSCNDYNLVKMETDDALSYLTKHKIKPSVQRMAVMEYLMDHRTHPTADEIYSALHPTMPTLSRTTVYNTLRLLAEQGAIAQLTIDERNVCYDADTSAHAHFLCTGCGKVFDIPLTDSHLESMAKMPEGFNALQCDLYFRGRCEKCSQQG